MRQVWKLCLSHHRRKSHAQFHGCPQRTQWLCVLGLFLERHLTSFANRLEEHISLRKRSFIKGYAVLMSFSFSLATIGENKLFHPTTQGPLACGQAKWLELLWAQWGHFQAKEASNSTCVPCSYALVSLHRMEEVREDDLREGWVESQRFLEIFLIMSEGSSPSCLRSCGSCKGSFGRHS